MAKFIWIPLISGRGRRQGAGDDYLWTQEIIENGDTEAVGLWLSRIQRRRRCDGLLWSVVKLWIFELRHWSILWPSRIGLNHVEYVTSKQAAGCIAIRFPRLL